MTAAQVQRLEDLQSQLPFRYYFSIINYIELISHLGTMPFEIVRSWFQRVDRICHGNILPAPEWEFMKNIGLGKYIHPFWVLDINSIASNIKMIASVESIDDLSCFKDEVEHYCKLRATDEKSFSDAISSLRVKVGNGPDALRKAIDDISGWFIGGLANFFLLIRPSQGKIHFRALSKKEQNRFRAAFTNGSGQLFHSHCTAVLCNTFKEGKKIDPNDLNDMLQLLLATKTRLFVTIEKLFRRYPTLDPQALHISSWQEFLSAEISNPLDRQNE